MRAAVFHGPEDVRIEDVAEPSPKADEVKIRVAACGLCGSDVHTYNLGSPAESRPFILGHEFSGEVVELGSDVAGIPLGSIVTVDPIMPCGACEVCRAGFPGICESYLLYGGSSACSGGVAEYATVKADLAFSLPDEIDAIQGALVEPLTVGFHAAAMANATQRDSAVVFGAGPIGIAVFLSLRARGLEHIFVVEPSDVRRRAIAELGADVVLDPTALAVDEILRQATGGRGPDIAFDAAGVASSFSQALAVTAARGRVVIVAKHVAPVATFSPDHIKRRELTVRGSHGHDADDIRAVIELMVLGAYPTDGWIELITIDDTVEKGLLPYRERAVSKVLVTPNGGRA